MYKKKLVFCFLAGLFFALFEGIFWAWGVQVFEFLGRKTLELFWWNVLGLLVSVLCFGLFIHFTALHVKDHGGLIKDEK